MADTQKLREQRANIWQQMQALIDTAEAEGRDFTGEEKATYDRMEGDLDGLGARIDRSEGRRAERPVRPGRPLASSSPRTTPTATCAPSATSASSTRGCTARR